MVSCVILQSREDAASFKRMIIGGTYRSHIERNHPEMMSLLPIKYDYKMVDK